MFTSEVGCSSVAGDSRVFAGDEGPLGTVAEAMVSVEFIAYHMAASEEVANMEVREIVSIP